MLICKGEVLALVQFPRWKALKKKKKKTLGQVIYKGSILRRKAPVETGQGQRESMTLVSAGD